jgi:hypothetical protein
MITLISLEHECNLFYHSSLNLKMNIGGMLHTGVLHMLLNFSIINWKMFDTISASRVFNVLH